MEHHLLCDKDSFDAILVERKRLELRRDDRGYLEGDTLVLFRQVDGEPDGAQVSVFVTHILGGEAGERYGLKPGYVAMSIEVI